MKALAPNTLIQGRYLVVHLIGKGGMGEVYLSVDQRLGSAVALKRTFFAGDEMLGSAFEREARTLARMRHPVLPKVSDHFAEGDEQYLVMEHIAGDDLAKRLEAAQKPFPLSWAMFWADQLLDSLAYLHSHEPPIIHRDIKPQNLKLTDDNHIILLDFGLSKTSTGQTHISSSGSTGSVVGYTPHYAPMEQIRGIGTSPRSDIYSLSATLYQLMTNVVPADALTRADALLNGSPDPIEPLSKVNSEVPESVGSVIMKGLEVSQERRHSTARDMQKELRRAFSGLQSAPAASESTEGVEEFLPAEQTRLMPSLPSLSKTSDSKPRVAEDEVAEASAVDEVDLNSTFKMDAIDSFPKAHAAGVSSNAAPAPPHVSEHRSEAARLDSFATVAAGRARAEKPPVEPKPPSPAPTRTAPRKSSKAAIAAGVLSAVITLGIGVAAAGWYFYSNYAAVPAPQPQPTNTTPMPATAEQEPEASTQTPTGEGISNVSTATDPVSANTDNRSTASPRTTNNPPRTRSATPAAPRATPTPRPRGRTDILQ